MSRDPTFAEWIEIIEDDYYPMNDVPGTALTRVLRAGGGWEWCLAIGLMGRPKLEFRGIDIDHLVQRALEALGDQSRAALISRQRLGLKL